MEPTVFVLDDESAIRQSIRWLIESIHLPVEEFSNSADFLRSVDPGRSGCLLLDVRMPGMGGLELQQILIERSYTLPVVVITGHADVPMAVQALQAGAFDFIEKPVSDKKLLHTVERAIAEDSTTRQRAHERFGIDQRMGRLTPRERQVMELVITGSSNKDMAANAASHAQDHRGPPGEGDVQDGGNLGCRARAHVSHEPRSQSLSPRP